MNHREFFAFVQKRPGMYFYGESYTDFCNFISGYDAGTSYFLLEGFREWLIVRLGEESSLAWSGLVEDFAHTSISGVSDHDTNDNTLKVETLFRLLDEFLELREKRDGLAKIFSDYLAFRADWLAKITSKYKTP